MPVHSKRIGWLRATVLGANDGILSTSSLVLGVAATHATQCNILVAGVGGLVAGAMSSHGGDCRHRVAVRNYCLSGANRKPAQSCAFINRPAGVACNNLQELLERQVAAANRR